MMTTDTTSVDALRTRLARAFEVAALRDPSAELVEFEAAVRADEVHEHGEHIAKDLDELASLQPEQVADVGQTIRFIAERVRHLSPPP